MYYVEQMLRAAGVWAGPDAEGACERAGGSCGTAFKNKSVLFAFVLNTGAGSFVCSHLKETAIKYLLRLLAQIIILY